MRFLKGGGGWANLMLCGPRSNITPNSKLTIPILSFFGGGLDGGVSFTLEFPVLFSLYTYKEKDLLTLPSRNTVWESAFLL